MNKRFIQISNLINRFATIMVLLLVPILFVTPIYAGDFADEVQSEIGQDVSAIESNLKLWLDASNINGNNNVGINDGDAVSEWMDLSGEGNHAFQTDQSQRPIAQEDLGQTVIHFDGSDDFKNRRTRSTWIAIFTSSII